MNQSIYLTVLAVVFVGMVFIVPQMMSLRIRILRALRLRRFADWHDRHRHGLTIALRIILAAMALVMGYLGITS
ncbi:hypothetical protein GF420_08695 [candidate division GN15 bacterium]|nr:hypothetical protein [candidate division GN15 bacterium]